MWYNQIQRLSSGWRLVLRGWSRPEVDGIGSEPLAKTGHSSQAETLGVSLNHKSNLFPSGFIGHLHHIVSWPLRGDGDKYTLRSGNQQPTTISTTAPFLFSWHLCATNRAGLTLLPSSHPLSLPHFKI